MWNASTQEDRARLAVAQAVNRHGPNEALLRVCASDCASPECVALIVDQCDASYATLLYAADSVRALRALFTRFGDRITRDVSLSVVEYCGDVACVVAVVEFFRDLGYYKLSAMHDAAFQRIVVLGMQAMPDTSSIDNFMAQVRGECLDWTSDVADALFVEACSLGDIDVVRHMHSRHRARAYAFALREAAWMGHNQILEYLIPRSKLSQARIAEAIGISSNLRLLRRYFKC